jgi:ABC-type nitrate/sulfonate/bicarbonate transport system substrate-binding protein
MLRAFGLAVGAVAIAFAAGFSPAVAAEKVKMSIAATSSNYATYFAALEKGYFLEEGFEVEIVQAGGGTATPAQISGEIEFNTSGATALSAILKGAPLKLVYFPWERPTYQVWSTQPEIKTLADLKGKSVGIQTRGDTFEIAMRVLLMKKGIDPNAVGYTPLGFGSGRFAAITAGSLPAALLTRADIEQMKELGTPMKGHLLADTFDEVRMPYTGLSVLDSALKRDRERIMRFVRACVKGHIFAATHKEPTLKILAKHNPRLSPRVLDVEYEEVVVASRTEYGVVSVELQRQETDLRATLIGVAKDKIRPLAEIYDFSLAEEANRALKAAGWKPAP